MPIAPSFQDLLTQGQSESQARRPDLTHLEGDITQAQLHAVAAMGDAVIRFAAQAFRDTFIDGASGDALTDVVDDHLNIQRNLATSAQVTVEYTRPSIGGGEPAGTILAGSQTSTEFDSDGNQVVYTTDSNLVFGLSVLGPLSVVATAQVAGRDGNVVANKVTNVIDQPVFDPTFTCDNPAAAAGGNDEETDEQLRTRARAFFQTLRRGTLAALEFGAKIVTAVRVAAASENLSTGIVTVTVTDADGNSTAQMVADVVTELENWRCGGSTVTVVGGSQLVTDVTVQLVVRSGYDVAANATTIGTAMVTRLSKLKADETMFLDSVIASIIAVSPDDILDVEFTAITITPGGAQPIVDLVPGTAEVIRGGTMTVIEAP